MKREAFGSSAFDWNRGPWPLEALSIAHELELQGVDGWVNVSRASTAAHSSFCTITQACKTDKSAKNLPITELRGTEVVYSSLLQH